MNTRLVARQMDRSCGSITIASGGGGGGITPDRTCGTITIQGGTTTDPCAGVTCPDGQECVDGTCQPAAGDCSSDAECQGDAICVDGTCTSPECQSDSACGEGLVCENGRCVEPGGSPVDGNLLKLVATAYGVYRTVKHR